MQIVTSQKGYSLIELIIVLLIIAVLGAVLSLLAGNFYYSKASVIAETEYRYDDIKSIDSFTRRIWAPSEFRVTTDGGGTFDLCIHSNVFYETMIDYCED